MLSVTKATNESFPVAILKKKKSGKVLETLFYTEPTRENQLKNLPDIRKELEKYIDPDVKDELRLQDNFAFECAPTIASQGVTSPRFINYYLSSSNSGKSYQIAQMVRRYLQLFPDNLVAYASANPIRNDQNYADLVDKIREVDVLGLQAPIDFSQEEYRNSLWIFDDCDSGFTASMEDLDNRLTKEELDKMTVTDKQKALRMLKQKCEVATEWINKSIKMQMMNGRKMKQSVIAVGHKPMEGRFENQIVNEGNGAVLFPASMAHGKLAKFLEVKLSLHKDDITNLLDEHEWFQYDFLYISYRTSKRFAMGVDFFRFLGKK